MYFVIWNAQFSSASGSAQYLRHGKNSRFLVFILQAAFYVKLFADNFILNSKTACYGESFEWYAKHFSHKTDD